MKLVKLLLALGIALPLVYFVSLFAIGALTPGYDHISRQPSELGMAGMPYAALFNATLLVTALCALAAGIGAFAGLTKLGAGWVLSGATGLCFGLLAFAFAMGAVFPYPDKLHFAFGVLPVGLLAPLFGALALGAAKDALPERILIGLGFAASIAVFAIIMRVGGLADEGNQGLWTRMLAALTFPNLALLCWSVSRRLTAD